jgi:hypothetical protein
MIDCLLDCFKNVRRNIVLRALSVDDQQPYLTLYKAVVVNDPDATAFTAAFTFPPYFSATTLVRDDISRIWIGGEPGTEFASLILAPIVSYKALEKRCFNDCQHNAIIRQ